MPSKDNTLCEDSNSPCDAAAGIAVYSTPSAGASPSACTSDEQRQLVEPMDGVQRSPGKRGHVDDGIAEESTPTATAEPVGPNADGVIDTAEETQYAASRTRHVVVAIFALFGFINQVQYVAYATIVREAEDKFGVSALEVNILSLLIPVVYCLGVIPGCWLYNLIGLRYGQIVGGGANAFAALLKLVSVWAPKYPIVVVAQVFVAIGQILYLSLPPLIAARWFPVGERTVATAVCSLMGFAGMAVGMFVPPRIVYLPDHVGNRAWGGLMGVQFGLSVLALALMVLFVPEKPKHKPSVTAAKEDADAEIWKTLKHPFRNANMIVLTISFGLITGFLTAVAAVLTQIVEPFGISEKHAGILAFAGIMGGAANCVAVGLAVGRLRRYKVFLILLAGVVAVLLIPIAVLMKTLENNDSFAVVAYVLVPLMEFLVLPLVPVAMEFSVELTYPDPETVSSTVVLMSMCFFSFVGMIVFTLVLGDHPTKENSFAVIMIVLVVCLVSVAMMFFVKEERRRYYQEHPLQACEHSAVELRSEPTANESNAETW